MKTNRSELSDLAKRMAQSSEQDERLLAAGVYILLGAAYSGDLHELSEVLLRFGERKVEVVRRDISAGVN